MTRTRCSRCQRPLRTCLCAWLAPCANRVELVILQHPLEVNNAKNTAGLLHLSLAHSRVLVGEQFATETLVPLVDPHKTTLLLYPDSPDPTLPRPPAPPSPLPAPENLRLLVLDATWRKSRKMLYLNPLLQQLPRLSLTDTPASRYHIRRAHKPGQLSTLEASCYALAQLESESCDYRPLLNAFDAFVARQLGFVGTQD